MPKPETEVAPTRGHKKKERTRHQLIAAAVDAIAERGEAFSISDITARAGVANGTFYNYFDDRKALVEAIVPQILSSFANQSAVEVVDDDPARRFAIISARALAHATVAPDEMRVVLRLDAAQQAVVGEAPLRHLQADIAEGFAAGRFTTEPSDATLDVVVGALLMAVRRIVHSPADDGYARKVLEQLLRSLGLAPDESAMIAEDAVAQTWADLPLMT